MHLLDHGQERPMSTLHRVSGCGGITGSCPNDTPTNSRPVRSHADPNPRMHCLFGNLHMRRGLCQHIESVNGKTICLRRSPYCYCRLAKWLHVMQSTPPGSQHPTLVFRLQLTANGEVDGVLATNQRPLMTATRCAIGKPIVRIDPKDPHSHAPNCPSTSL